MISLWCYVMQRKPINFANLKHLRKHMLEISQHSLRGIMDLAEGQSYLKKWEHDDFVAKLSQINALSQELGRELDTIYKENR